MSASEIRRAMPLLAANEGVWEGWYRHYEADSGKLIEQHRSRLIHRIHDDGRYDQSNHYWWDDGRTDLREFQASYSDGRIWFDTALIRGWCAETPLDQTGRTSLLYWIRKGEDGDELFEMIQGAGDDLHRARVWQWLRKGVCFKRTLIDEVRVSADWRGFSDTSPPRG